MPYKDPENRKAHNREYYTEYYAANKEERKAYNAAYHKANKERRNADARAWREANKEERKATVRAWQTANPENRMWSDAKKRAKKKGIPFSILPSDIIIPIHCPIGNCGVLLARGKGKFQNCSPTLDCVIPHWGYVPGNARVICHRCNRKKDNHTIESLQAISDYILYNLI